MRSTMFVVPSDRRQPSMTNVSVIAPPCIIDDDRAIEYGIYPTYSGSNRSGFVSLFDGERKAAHVARKWCRALYQQARDKGEGPQQALVTTVGGLYTRIRGWTSGYAVAIEGGVLHVMGIGDITALLVRPRSCVQITTPHTVDDSSERRRIEDARLEIDEHNAVSWAPRWSYHPWDYPTTRSTRSLGITEHRPSAILQVPVLNRVELGKVKREFLVLMTDETACRVDHDELPAVIKRSTDVSVAQRELRAYLRLWTSEPFAIVVDVSVNDQ